MYSIVCEGTNKADSFCKLHYGFILKSQSYTIGETYLYKGLKIKHKIDKDARHNLKEIIFCLTRKTNQKGGSKTVRDATTEFHTYKVEWLPDRLIFYVDDVQYFTYIGGLYHPCPDEDEWPFDKIDERVFEIEEIRGIASVKKNYNFREYAY